MGVAIGINGGVRGIHGDERWVDATGLQRAAGDTTPAGADRSSAFVWIITPNSHRRTQPFDSSPLIVTSSAAAYWKFPGSFGRRGFLLIAHSQRFALRHPVPLSPALFS